MKPIFVAFATNKLEKSFEELEEGKFEDKKLFAFIERAIQDLKKDPETGRQIPKKL